MKTEHRIARFVTEAAYGDLGPDVLAMVHNQLLGVLGATIAAASGQGCETVVDMVRELGGKPEASIFVHGDRVPAHQAAFVNAVMARALDFEDSIAPGAHVGAAIIPAAFAAAEMVGQEDGAVGRVVTGADFLAAIAVGTELAVRMNLGELEYDGFDPTSVCVSFGSTAAAGKIVGLTEEQMWNALALAFCRCGGSLQANVDGALAVRMIQGWTAETGVTCARLAKKGITGPRNYLEGVYGYFHLFGRDRVGPADLLAGLGSEYRLDALIFKKYPNCVGTQAATDLILAIIAEANLEARDIDRVKIHIGPYLYRLVGHPFQLGVNPRVSAQFNVRFCVANALLHGSSALAHFEPEAVGDPEVLKLVERVEVIPDAALDRRGHTAADLWVTTKDGREYFKQTDAAPGMPGRPLSRDEHLRRFWECIEYGANPLANTETGTQITHALDHLHDMEDVRSLTRLLLPE